MHASLKFKRVSESNLIYYSGINPPFIVNKSILYLIKNLAKYFNENSFTVKF
jgi:hypothetical protein